MYTPAAAAAAVAGGTGIAATDTHIYTQ